MEKMASFGPYKGTEYNNYYNKVDITKYLKDGENEFFAEVLQLTSPNEIGECKYLF